LLFGSPSPFASQYQAKISARNRRPTVVQQPKTKHRNNATKPFYRVYFDSLLPGTNCLAIFFQYIRSRFCAIEVVVSSWRFRAFTLTPSSKGKQEMKEIEAKHYYHYGNHKLDAGATQ